MLGLALAITLVSAPLSPTPPLAPVSDQGSSAAAVPPSSAPASVPAWTDHAPDPPSVIRAQIGVPREAGSLKITEVRDYGSEGLDNVAQYASADAAISGTIFIYYPTLPDTGLTFLATDATIRRRFGPQTRVAQDSLVTVGGVAGAGRRIVYEGASEGQRATMATFIRAGAWMLVLRVSGPHSRAGEIGSDLDALAAGLLFTGANKAVPAHVISAEECPAVQEQDSQLSKPSGGQATMLLLMAATNELRDKKGKTLPDVIGRVPDRLCLARSGLRGEAVVLTYRPVTKPTGLYVPKLFELVGDAGSIYEATAISNHPDQIIVIEHGIGRLRAYGIFSSPPSAAQLDSVIARDPTMPRIGEAVLKPEGGSDIDVNCSEFREGCGEDKGRRGSDSSAPAPAQPATSSL